MCVWGGGVKSFQGKGDGGEVPRADPTLVKRPLVFVQDTGQISHLGTQSQSV